MKIYKLFLVFIILLNSILLQLKLKKINETFYASLTPSREVTEKIEIDDRGAHINITNQKYNKLNNNINNLKKETKDHNKKVNEMKSVNSKLRDNVNRLTKKLKETQQYS